VKASDLIVRAGMGWEQQQYLFASKGGLPEEHQFSFHFLWLDGR